MFGCLYMIAILIDERKKSQFDAIAPSTGPRCVLLYGVVFTCHDASSSTSDEKASSSVATFSQ